MGFSARLFNTSWPLFVTHCRIVSFQGLRLIFFAFSDNLSAENYKLSAQSGLQRLQLLECMLRSAETKFRSIETYSDAWTKLQRQRWNCESIGRCGEFLRRRTEKRSEINFIIDIDILYQFSIHTDIEFCIDNAIDIGVCVDIDID